MTVVLLLRFGRIQLAGQVQNGSKGLRDHVRDDTWVEESRANKQTAVARDEGEIPNMFDKPSGRRHTSKGDKGLIKKQTRKSTVDLRLLFLCANGLPVDVLKQIRENSSSSSGDGSQTLAHYFDNGLEVRIAGNERMAGSFFTPSTYRKISVVEVLKKYQACITACPFMKFPIYLSGYMISKLAEKAKVLHVVQRISQHPAGRPKLRITGITNVIACKSRGLSLTPSVHTLSSQG
ncbi:hypothetical protein MLD38_009652 [Melastoma candidum]|uniref:Uncharacterized protein n=1 Tax=Melastoma candidum TaxID=119954 RepID=A0ACB9S195_9MYRT|nr:hypothetical protein MLD38_009652 [Melastoma candidum]